MQNDLNLAIVAAITEHAKNAWRFVVSPSGSWSAAEIDKNLLKGAAGWRWAETFTEEKNELCGVEIDSFKCQFYFRAENNDGKKSFSRGVFYMLAQFEKLAGVSKSACARFIGGVSDSPKNEVCRLSVNVPAGSLGVADFVAKDDLRPVMNCVCLDVDGWCVSSDASTLAAFPGSVSLVSGSMADACGIKKDSSLYNEIKNVLCPVNVYKTICGAGAVVLSYTSDGGDVTVTARNEAGDVLTAGAVPCGRFPRWRSVVPSVPASPFTVDVKKIKPFISNVAKEYGRNFTPPVLFNVSGDSLILSYYDYDFEKGAGITTEICNDLHRVGAFGVSAQYMQKAFKYIDGRIYAGEASRALVFGCKNGGLLLIMPKTLTEYYRTNKETGKYHDKTTGADFEILQAVTETAPALDVVPMMTETKTAKKKTGKNARSAAVPAVAPSPVPEVAQVAPAVASYPCVSGEATDVRKGAPVREVLPVYDDFNAVSSPDLLPVLARVDYEKRWNNEKFVREFFNLEKAVRLDIEACNRRAEKQLKNTVSFMVHNMSDDLREALAAALAPSAGPSIPEPSPVVVAVPSIPDNRPDSSRPARRGVVSRFVRWCAAAAVALLALLGLHGVAVAPSDTLKDDHLTVCEDSDVLPVVELPGVECVAAAVPILLPGVECVGVAPEPSAALPVDAVVCIASPGSSLNVAPVSSGAFANITQITHTGLSLVPSPSLASL